MSIAVLYDVHGNLPALEAVLAEAASEGCSELIIGGDVLPGPLATECFDRLQADRDRIRAIRGNGEADTLRLRAGEAVSRVPDAVHRLLEWSVARLADRHAAWIESWPATLRTTHPVLGRVLFCHATPRDDWEIFTRRSPDSALEPIFTGAGAEVVVCGHTHMPVDRRVGDVRVVTAGSVGMPFGEPGAHWLLIDERGMHFRRADYDRRAAAKRFAGTDYPGLDRFEIVDPPSEARMLDTFDRVAIGRGGRHAG
jgi:predicted phosphodiesterase